MAEEISIGPLTVQFLCSKYAMNGRLDLFEMTAPPHGHMPVAHYRRARDGTVYSLTVTVNAARRAACAPSELDPVHATQHRAQF